MNVKTFFPNSFPILLHKNLGQGGSNKNHQTPPYLLAALGVVSWMFAAVCVSFWLARTAFF